MDLNTANNLFTLLFFLSPSLILCCLLSIAVLIKGQIKQEEQNYLYIWKAYIYAILTQILIILLLMLVAFIFHSMDKGINTAYGFIPIMILVLTSFLTVFIYLYFLNKLKPDKSLKSSVVNDHESI